MASRIQIRRDTAANWTSANPSLLAGELCYETDSGRMKIGTGANWSSTDYFVYEDTKLAELLDVTITGAAAGDFLRYNNSSSVWYNDAVNLATDTIGDYVESLVAGTGLTITDNSGEGSTPTLAIGQAVGTSASVTFAQVTLGNEPSASNHAVTKQYVDAVSAGINWHLSAKLATATILPFSPNYSNGTSGAGATLTATENGRLSVDGINATTNDRVLIKNQSSALQNGIYSVTAQGSASAVYVLTRTTDFDGSVNDYIVRGDALYIGSGSVNGNQGFIVNSVGTSGENLVHVVGTDDITFTQFTGTANIIAGTGITKTGNTLSIGQDVATSASVTFARVYGEFTGNADTATTLATPRNIQLAGAVTGTVPFNGSASVEILTTMNSTLNSLTDVSASAPGENTYLKWVSTGWEPDVINLGTDTTGNYMVDLTQGTGVTITHTPGEGSNATIAIGQDVGTSASVTFGQVTAPLLGNATSATTLQTSRNIAGQAFNGSADISIAPTNLTGVTATATEINVLDGITASTAELNILDGVTASYTEINVLDGITASTAELNILDGVTASASELNILDGATLSTTELNYVNGVTSAIQTQLNNKASSTASPVITLGGDLSGSATFTNLGNATLTATIVANSVELGTDTTGNYMSDLTQGTGLIITHTPGEGSNATIAIGQDVGTSASVQFAAVTSPLIGNASTATVLQTARNIAGQSFDGSTNISIAPTDLTGVTSTAAELNILDGATLSTTELNYVDGVTSAIQTQIDSKAPSASPTFTGVVTLPDNTVALGTKTTGDYVASLVAGTGVTVTNNSGETATPTVAIGQAVGTSASVTFSNITATGVVTLAADPESALQAATKQYVDNISAGINFHAAVVAATTGNLAGTYNNGTSGVGATITKTSNGSIGTIDGATVVVGSRILLKSQTDSKQNGIYTVTAVGSVSAPWVVTRATDADNSLAGEMLYGDFCFVMGGSTNAGYGYINNSTANPIVLGTDNVTYAAFNAAQTITAGTGLDLTSNVMSLNATLDNLSNVTAPSPTDGHFLKYVSASTAWIPASIPTINALDDIGDVSASAPANGEVLQWNGTAWVPSLVVGPPGADGADGADGAPGIAGEAGMAGAAGAAGEPGPPGADGSDGADGDDGADGLGYPALQTPATQYYDTSTTFGSTTFTLNILGTAYIVGNRVRLIWNTNPNTYFEGTITSYDSPSTTLYVDVDLAVGASGAKDVFNLALTGEPGPLETVGFSFSSNTSNTASVAVTSVTVDSYGRVTAVSANGYQYADTSNAGVVRIDGNDFLMDAGTLSIKTGAIYDGDINASAGIALSKLATGTAGNILVYNGSGVLTSVTESGDITVNASGVTAISSGVIVNADISDTAAIGLGKLADVSTNAQTASYTLVLADKNKVVEMGVGSANTLTVPLNSSVAFPVGSQINILQTGSGQTTITATGGVTINATPGLKMRTQWSYATLIKRATDTWVLVGDISA